MSEAVAEVETGLVTSFAKIAVGLAGDLRLALADRLNLDSGISEEIVQSATQKWVLIPVGDDAAFNVAGWSHG